MTNRNWFVVGEYYWFDLPEGWMVGRIRECSLHSNGLSVDFCGSDESVPVPYCYTEHIEKPKDD